MKLPIEVSKQIYKDRGVSVGYEALVRDCAEWAFDLWFQGIPAQEFKERILSRYGLTESPTEQLVAERAGRRGK